MKFLLQIDFPYNGPFKEDFTNMMADLAKDIATEKGLVFKVWTENEKTKEAGGIYLFNNEKDANRYLEKHTKRLETFGFEKIRSKVFEVNKGLSVLSKATFLN